MATAAERLPSRRRIAGILLPLAAAIGLTLITLSGLSTARGRITASTSTESLFGAGMIDLVVENGSVQATQELLFDETGLYGGQVLESCLLVSYQGSFDTATIRFHARATGGSGLGRFLDTTIERGFGVSHDCSDFTTGSVLFAGSLDALLSRHSTYGSGLHIRDEIAPGESTMVRVRVEVADDNQAQGLSSEFSVFFEVRP